MHVLSVCVCECVHCNVMARAWALAVGAKLGGRVSFKMKKMGVCS